MTHAFSIAAGFFLAMVLSFISMAVLNNSPKAFLNAEQAASSMISGHDLLGRVAEAVAPDMTAELKKISEGLLIYSHLNGKKKGPDGAWADRRRQSD